MSRRLNGHICSYTPSALNAGAKRSGATCHMAIPQYQLIDQFDQPIGRHFCCPCDRRHIVTQMAGDEDYGGFGKRRFGKNMAADVSAKKIWRNVSGKNHLPKRFVV